MVDVALLRQFLKLEFNLSASSELARTIYQKLDSIPQFFILQSSIVIP
jgi:hypothetical protein